MLDFVAGKLAIPSLLRHSKWREPEIPGMSKRPCEVGLGRDREMKRPGCSPP